MHADETGTFPRTDRPRLRRAEGCLSQTKHGREDASLRRRHRHQNLRLDAVNGRLFQGGPCGSGVALSVDSNRDTLAACLPSVLDCRRGSAREVFALLR